MTDYVTTAQIADRLPERAAFDAWLPGAVERGWHHDTDVAWWAWQHQQREIETLCECLRDVLQAEFVRPSCQAGMMQRCRCYSCSKTRAMDAIATGRKSDISAPVIHCPNP